MTRIIAVLLGMVTALAVSPAGVSEAVGQAVRPVGQIDTLALRAHTQFLSSDLLEGRGTGTRGEHLAASYITSQLRRLGVPGAGADGGYLQPLPLAEAEVDREATRLEIERGGDTQRFRPDGDFVVSRGSADAFRDFEGRALFAGTAALAADALADAGSLEGRVIVVYGTLGTDAATLVPDWVERGAEGVVLLAPQPERYAVYRRSGDRFRSVIDAPIDNPVWQPRLPVLIAGPALSRALLVESGLAPDALNGEQPFDALPLDRTVRARVRVELHDVDASNIAAMIPGGDPDRRDEVVAYTAHYDHLGIGEPDEAGDSIYNGFSDNAAGVAMLLSIAEAMRDDPPARSVLFLFFTAEERGLLGSSYYTVEPVAPLERTVAVINLDAGAPPAPPRSWSIAGGEDSTLGERAVGIAESRGWEAGLSSGRPNSDYWPFLAAGVPAVFLIPGQDWEGVTEREAEALHRRWDHYHEPADEWAPEFPLGGLRRYATFALALGRDVAEASGRPRMTEPGPRDR